jgi:4'-phosphopantetheinyl transferase
MGTFLKRNIGNAIVGIWEITESVDHLISNLELDKQEEKLYNGFRNDIRKLHWLSYRNLLKEMITPEEYSHVNYDEFGKPFMKNRSIHLSVSHSGKYSAAIVSRNFPVGIDIEITSPKIEKIVHKFLSADEVKNIGDESRLEELYVCWGAKESLYKLYGKRNLLFQENIFLQPFDYNNDGILSGEIRTGKFHRKYSIHYEKINDYMLVYSVADR